MLLPSPAVAALYKWQLFAHTEFDAIFFTDVDVDLFPVFGGLAPNGRGISSSNAGRQLAAAWTRGLSAFVRSAAHLIASADYHSPINTGVMLLRPSEVIYGLGLRVLARNAFDPTLGFDRAGRPSDVLRGLRSHASPQLWREVLATRMLWQDRWTFVGGHACQGLFVYVFLILPWKGEAHAAATAAAANASPDAISLKPQEHAGPARALLRGEALLGGSGGLWFRFPRNISERRLDGLGTHHVHHFRAQGKVVRRPASRADPNPPHALHEAPLMVDAGGRERAIDIISLYFPFRSSPCPCHAQPWYPRGAQPSCRTYFAFATAARAQRAIAHGGSAASFCWGLLRDKARCMQPKLSAEQCALCRRSHVRFVRSASSAADKCARKVEKCEGTQSLVL